MVDSESVFVAEVKLSNSKGLLKPGMKGTGRIACGTFPLAWNLFHQPWEAAIKAYHGW